MGNLRESKKDVDILLVGSYPPPHGGQSIHIRQLFSYIRQTRFTVRVLNTGPDKTTQHSNVDIVNSSKELLRAVLFDNSMHLLHLHLSNINDFGKLIPVFAASLAKHFRWVLTVHSGGIESKLRNISTYQQYIIKLILRRIDNVICVNNVIRDALSKWTDYHKLVLIPAFSINFSENDLPSEIESFFHFHSPVITCVGFYEPVYGFDLAILGTKRLKEYYRNIGLIIIGGKRNSQKYEILVDQNSLNRDVLMCGDMNHADCLSIIKRSSVFLRPTLYDGDAISVREALALQVPVVASETEYRPSSVSVFIPGDLDDMVAKIRYVIQLNRKKNETKASDLDNLSKIKELYATLIEK
ncbi:MAG: glycosyltransferase family 4 protein [Thermodesulfobacteriota bacterium]|nr:glycosyltransferase family 4 protein [Thermodesulfobacteriota bacterium]